MTPPALFMLLAGWACAARAGEPPRALLFVPDPAALDWAAFRALVSSAPAPFTLALAPEETPEAQRAWLRDAAAAGRLELALRLAHDPLVPLLESSRPGAFRERLAAAQPAFRAAFGTDPAGFVAAGAVLDPPTRTALAAQRLRWTAAGEGGYSRPWLAGAGLAAVPLRISTQAAPGAPPGAAVDETVALVPGTGLGALSILLAQRGPRWGTVAEAAAAAEPFGVAPATWPAWSGAGGWLAEPDRRRARELYGLAVAAVDRYQNSGSASVARLDAAAAALDRAAAARHYRPGAPAEPLLAELRAAFRAAGEQAPAADGQASGEVSASLLERGVAFAAAEPASTAPWTPRSLRVERAGADVAVEVALSNVTPGGTAELYIDVNGLAGMGATRLLGERRAVLRVRDGWEFAVTVSSGGAALWRVGGSSPLESLPVAADAASGTLRLVLPGRRLRGNPSGWGYLLLTGPPGGPTLLLGDPADQKSLEAAGPPPVLKALRLIGR